MILAGETLVILSDKGEVLTAATPDAFGYQDEGDRQ